MVGFQSSMYAFSTQQFVNNKPIYSEQYKEVNDGNTGELDYRIASKGVKKSITAKKTKGNKKWKLNKTKKTLTKKQLLEKIRTMRKPKIIVNKIKN